MPESRSRKKAAPRKKPVKRPAKKLTAVEVPDVTVEPTPRRRPDIAREIPEDERYKVDPLPEPATEDQLLVACMKLDPLAQEVMIAARLAAMPNPTEGGPPINIHRKVRPLWAHQLRKLGIFCIPELATHELVAPDASGMLVNHTGATLQSIDRKGLWEKAKAQNPQLGKLVDEAKTPAQKRAAMRTLASKLPTEARLAMDRLIAASPEDLEPV